MSRWRENLYLQGMTGLGARLCARVLGPTQRLWVTDVRINDAEARGWNVPQNPADDAPYQLLAFPTHEVAFPFGLPVAPD